MEKLTFGTLKRREGRIDKFLTKFKDEKEFVFVDGTSAKIDKVLIGSTEYSPSDADTTLKVILNASPKLPTLKIKVGTKTMAFGSLAKTSEFGGQGGGATAVASVGGKVTEVLSETGFCFYYAMLVTGHLDNYSPDVWSTVKNVTDFKSLCVLYPGVSQILKYQLNDVSDLNKNISSMHSFLTDHEWHEVLISQVKAFKSKYPSVGTSYFLARPSAIPADFNPYSTYKLISDTIKSYAGLSRAIGEDKWNPADFWIFNQKGITLMKQWNQKAKRLASMKAENYSISYMNLVNKQLIKLYKQGYVYPVSLKKTSGSPTIKEINTGKDEITQIVEYEKVELLTKNLDVQIYFTVKTFDNNKLISTKKLKAKMKTKAGGFRLELEETGGGAARHGSIGVGLQEFIIKETNDQGIKKLESIRSDQKYSNIKDRFPTSGSRHWMGVSEYTRSSDSQVLIPYLEELMKDINTRVDIAEFTSKYSKSEEIGTKTGAAELAVAIHNILNKHSRDIVIENLFNAAGSQGISAGVSNAQLENRKRLLGMSDDDIVTIINDTKSMNAVLQAGFHLKIM